MLRFWRAAAVVASTFIILSSTTADARETSSCSMHMILTALDVTKSMAMTDVEIDCEVPAGSGFATAVLPLAMTEDSRLSLDADNERQCLYGQLLGDASYTLITFQMTNKVGRGRVVIKRLTAKMQPTSKISRNGQAVELVFRGPGSPAPYDFASTFLRFVELTLDRTFVDISDPTGSPAENNAIIIHLPGPDQKVTIYLKTEESRVLPLVITSIIAFLIGSVPGLGIPVISRRLLRTAALTLVAACVLGFAFAALALVGLLSDISYLSIVAGGAGLVAGYALKLVFEWRKLVTTRQTTAASTSTGLGTP